MPDFPIPSEDDGLYIPEVGEHSKYKHYFVWRYIDAFTTAMKGKWGGLHYIDLFAGAGIEMLRNSQKLEYASPMLAARAPKSFDKLHLCEMNKQKYDALKTRIEKIRPDSQILHGDANEKVHEIASEIPDRSLSLAFLDPYGLHLDFETLKILAKKRADLIIFFPDRLDALRNWAKYYFDNPESKLDQCLGSGIDWRTHLQESPTDHHAELLRDMYIEQIKTKLGYTHFDFERIKTLDGRPIYYLIFCAKHERATKLWRGISGKKPDGQRTFDFTEQ